MGRFLVVSRRQTDDQAAALSRALEEDARSLGFATVALNAHAWLGVQGPGVPRQIDVGGWTLIGDVFNRRSPVLPSPRLDDPWDYERKLMARFWGRYVGVRFEAGDQLAAVLRDPSGALECVTWRQDGLAVVCGAAEDFVLRRLRPAWRLNVGRIAEALRDPVPETGALLLDGPIALEPGSVLDLSSDRPPDELWTPADFARRSLGRAPDLDDAADQLRSAVDEATAGLAGVSSPLAAEVSGGLDSSIVAASLVTGAPNGVAMWLNAFGAAPEADERTYVAALANTLGIAPQCVPHAAEPLTQVWLEALSPGFRPGLTALDRPHDLDWARRLEGAGIVGLMTGAGGDSILFQRATMDVFVDRWRARPWRDLFAREVVELAASNEISVWTMIADARRRRRAPHPAPRRDHPMLPALSGAGPRHPWLAGWDEFGPAKAMHLAGVVDNVARHGPSELTARIDVRHPLCAQPVIEACLALPTVLLTTGGRERGLARLAFRDRLPAQIIDRRSKGDMTRIYGRMILDGLDVLRPWLIEGRLAALKVIDPEAADRALTREALVWGGRYSTIMVAAAFESWVRLWEARLKPPL
ncbi:MAG: hypothetical protein HYU62_04095 [Caulobacterales bacterium]|nr:hypothetical protein [Caulobacterales bacterium]